MNRIVAVLLAVTALLAGWRAYGWQGLVLAVTLIVFWMVLQFNRALRVMKNATSVPIGHVDSAVMLHSRLRQDMTLVQVIALTRSLGRRVSVDPETWAWSDAGGATVTVVLADGKLKDWALSRAASDAATST